MVIQRLVHVYIRVSRNAKYIAAQHVKIRKSQMHKVHYKILHQQKTYFPFFRRKKNKPFKNIRSGKRQYA